jgi:hypothetical protein
VHERLFLNLYGPLSFYMTLYNANEASGKGPAGDDDVQCICAGTPLQAPDIIVYKLPCMRACAAGGGGGVKKSVYLSSIICRQHKNHQISISRHLSDS